MEQFNIQPGNGQEKPSFPLTDAMMDEIMKNAVPPTPEEIARRPKIDDSTAWEGTAVDPSTRKALDREKLLSDIKKFNS